MEKILTILQEYALTAGMRLVGAALILLIGFRLIRIVTHLLKLGKFWNNMDASARSFITSLISIILKALLFLTAAAVLGVPMTNMVAIFGSAGLAVGLSFQGSLSNFAGGLIILSFRPFNVGDYIESGADAGTVLSISILYTTLRTPDGRRVIIPNGTLSNSPVTNYSAEAARRVDVECPVARESEIDRVRDVLLTIAAESPLVLDEPAPMAVLVRQEASAMVFSLRVWCKTSDFLPATFELNEQVKRGFDRGGIRIPNPQMDVHVADPGYSSSNAPV